MLDLQKVKRPRGWVTEREACEDWFKSTHDPITIDHLHDPEHGRYLRCRNIPDPGTYISQYGEFGEGDRFSFIAESVDLDDEVVVAVAEDAEDEERIEIPFLELCCLDEIPMWSTLWALYHEPSHEEVIMYNDCSISVYESESGDYYIGIDGCGYDFYEAHWLPLYRKKCISWHSTEAGWVGELKARISSYVEASIDLPAEMTWSERSDLLARMTDDLLDSKRIERMARRARMRHRVSCILARLKAALTFDPKHYRSKRKRLA